VVERLYLLLSVVADATYSVTTAVGRVVDLLERVDTQDALHAQVYRVRDLLLRKIVYRRVGDDSRHEYETEREG